jgi:hypothetical protein
MMKSVRKKAMPMSTCPGGTCCRDKARLIKSSTMDMRRKLVSRMTILGARDNIVSSRSNCMLNATSWPVSGERTDRSTNGMAEGRLGREVVAPAAPAGKLPAEGRALGTGTSRALSAAAEGKGRVVAASAAWADAEPKARPRRAMQNRRRRPLVDTRFIAAA